MEILTVIFLILGIAYFIGGRKAVKFVINTVGAIVLILFLIAVAMKEEKETPGFIASMIFTFIAAPTILTIRDYCRERKAKKRAY
ncbi:hypothetical protein GWK41_05440 [Persephonella atlantica]|uniref:Uncharacterized protein n=1 Tax=Persephonella atlantica TaxID=2699429 RepID=A0ABS1GHT9_9AQUI|nr:hypothetical protein [Persephonella atlantica]MBK3332504.1 hypothetical protein [Persephonella atlantica]